MFDPLKACRIVKSGHVLEVYFYDTLPMGKGGNVAKEEQIEIPDYLEWVDNNGTLRCLQAQKMDKKYWGYDEFGNDLYLKGLLPDEWLVDKVVPKDERRAKEYVRSSNHRAREKIRRLALSNFTDGDTFLTLTFRENVQDLDVAHNELKKFFKRLRHRYGAEIPYLGVIEFQDKNGRGAIHYHCLIGLDLGINYTDSDQVRAMEVELGEHVWKNGFVDLQTIKGVDNLGAYLVKYLTKDLGDSRLSGRKHYVLSKGLNHPELIKDTTVVLDSLEGHFPTFSSNYENEFCGKIQYLEYNIKRS